MKYEIGDKIVVLHSDEDGTVVDIINDKMVMIEVRGVKFPAYMDQIDFPYYKMFTQKKAVEKKKIHVDQVRTEKSSPRRKNGDGVLLQFFPVFDKDIFEDDVVEKLKVYIVNNNEEAYRFSYSLMFGNERHFELKNTILGLNDFYLHDIAFEDMNDSPRFDLEFTLEKDNNKKAAYFERTLKLKGKQIFKKIEEIKAQNEPSFSFELFTQYPDKAEEEKVDLSSLGSNGIKMYDLSKIKDFLAPARSVVDLHIGKLTDAPSRMSPAEIMQLQMSTFEKYYELAILHKLPELILIHGVGEGRLRDEIHEKLRHKKEVTSFVNQYHPMYGYGATQVFFSY